MTTDQGGLGTATKFSVISKALSEGYILLAGSNVSMLVMRPRYRAAGEYYAPIDVAYDLFEEAKAHNWIKDIPENSQHYRCGWREMGLEPPPDGQAYYLMMQ